MSAIKTQGSKFYLKSGTAFVQLLLVSSASHSGGEGQNIPTTALEDTSPSSVPGTPSPEVYTLPVMFDPREASHVLLDTYKASGATFVVKQIFPFSGSTNTWYFDAQVQSWPSAPSMDQNSVLMKSLQLTMNNYRSTE